MRYFATVFGMVNLHTPTMAVIRGTSLSLTTALRATACPLRPPCERPRVNATTADCAPGGPRVRRCKLANAGYSST